MICANCEHNDGMVYTSNPPMYKCTITGEYYHGFHECEVEFVPVKRGRWIIDREFGNDVMSNEQMVICSECGKGIFWGKQNYCPNCGSRMDLDGDAE